LARLSSLRFGIGPLGLGGGPIHGLAFGPGLGIGPPRLGISPPFLSIRPLPIRAPAGKDKAGIDRIVTQRLQARSARQVGRAELQPRQHPRADDPNLRGEWRIEPDGGAGGERLVVGILVQNITLGHAPGGVLGFLGDSIARDAAAFLVGQGLDTEVEDPVVGAVQGQQRLGIVVADHAIADRQRPPIPGKRPD
jgi:hypothetical protein